MRFALLLAAIAWVGLAAPSIAASPSRNFHADMAAEWETKFTESPATGLADFHLDLATLTFTWKVTFKDLSGPVETIRLHGPAQPGANGAVIFDLGKKGVTSPVTGSQALTEAQVQYLLYGWTYINIATKKWPHGEIRGQLDVKPVSEPSAQ
jgi:hypothetical protein